MKKIYKIINNIRTHIPVVLFVTFILVAGFTVDRSEAGGNSIIEQIALWTNSTVVSDETMVRIAEIESNYNAKAKSPTGALGLYQFIKKTWISVAKYMPKDMNTHLQQRLNPRTNTLFAVKLAELNYWAFKEATGGAPEPYQIYISHNLGVRAAIKLQNANSDTIITKKLIGSRPKHNPLFLMKKGRAVTVEEALRRYKKHFEGVK